MATYIAEGDRISYTPSSAVEAGDVIVQGELVGVATSNIAANTTGSLAVAGVIEFAKASATVFAAGANVYWDNTNKLAVAADGGGANKFVGKAVQAAPAGITTVRVRLSQ